MKQYSNTAHFIIKNEKSCVIYRDCIKLLRLFLVKEIKEFHFFRKKRNGSALFSHTYLVLVLILTVFTKNIVL